MRVVVDIECNRLHDPDKIWVVVAKDIDTEELYVFRDKEAFRAFASNVSLWVGHNILGYDYPILCNLGYLDELEVGTRVIDTLIISKMVNFTREGHSIEDYGLEFEYPKGTFSDWSKYSWEMEEYCKRDVEICHKIFIKYRKVCESKDWHQSIQLENRFQLVCNLLSKNGFAFNKDKAETLLGKVQDELAKLDKDILEAFPPKYSLIRNIRKNKDGSINRVDARYIDNVDGRYLVRTDNESLCLYRREEFNPSSHKQLVDVLYQAGWKPSDKTKTHVEWLRERKTKDLTKSEFYAKYGWRVNETNLLTLPASAPKAARLLASRILHESRRRTLVEWISLVRDDGRIHGDFQGIGAWTHRMAHQRPNTANIPNEKDDQGRPKLLGGDLRQLWYAPKGRLLVGCDAEGIQLRVFAHYINDPEFTREVSDGDPHTLNKTVLGHICKDRQSAKRFIYALLLGAGMDKLSEILECSKQEAEVGLSHVLERYSGFKHLKENVFPRDVRRGYFIGLDGRKVPIPRVNERPHLVMSGYLQNGEAIIMKKATLHWMDLLAGSEEPRLRDTPYLLVDLVHDEWQTECKNDVMLARQIAQAQCEALRKVGVELNMKCPLAGSFKRKNGDETIGTNWRVTH
jgi:DNA polymerase I